MATLKSEEKIQQHDEDAESSQTGCRSLLKALRRADKQTPALICHNCARRILRAAAIWRGYSAQAWSARQADGILPQSCRAPTGLPFRSAHIFFLPKTAPANIGAKSSTKTGSQTAALSIWGINLKMLAQILSSPKNLLTPLHNFGRRLPVRNPPLPNPSFPNESGITMERD